MAGRELAEIIGEISTEDVVEFLRGVEEDLEELLRSSGLLEEHWWG